jgi:hypothetical protein
MNITNATWWDDDDDDDDDDNDIFGIVPLTYSVISGHGLLVSINNVIISNTDLNYQFIHIHISVKIMHQLFAFLWMSSIPFL